MPKTQEPEENVYRHLEPLKGHHVITSLHAFKDGMVEMLVTDTDEKSGKVSYTMVSAGDHAKPAQYAHGVKGTQTPTSTPCGHDLDGRLFDEHSETHASGSFALNQAESQKIRDTFKGFEKLFKEHGNISDAEAHTIADYMTKEIQNLPKLPGSRIFKD